MKKLTVGELFGVLRSRLDSDLETGAKAHGHPGARGDSSEAVWARYLREHLPARYSVAKGNLFDHRGGQSDEIDLVLFDRQYTTTLHDEGGRLFLPAESVYAVFEVKQRLTPRDFAYAGKKAASVRRLERTSAPIYHAGGIIAKPKEPIPILAGYLCLDSARSRALETRAPELVANLPEEERIDACYAVRSGAFFAVYGPNGSVSLDLAPADEALRFFHFGLLERLHKLGTATAIEFDKYR